MELDRNQILSDAFGQSPGRLSADSLRLLHRLLLVVKFSLLMFSTRLLFSVARGNWSRVHRQTARSIQVASPLPLRYAPVEMPNPHGKQRADRRKRPKKGDDRKNKGSGFDEVLQVDIDHLLARNRPEKQPELEEKPPELPERFSEIEVTISEISSTGDGLALSESGDHVYVVPFTVPGDKALVKTVRQHPELSYTLVDFIKVIEPGPQRNDSLIGCGYFAKCSGCQLQMMSYEDQLAHKKRIVEKAYANFSGLIPELVPAVGDTLPSPRQYGYRTKLTPH